MTRARDAVFAVASVVFGATWLFAAAAKIVWPLGAYEFVGRFVPAGVAAKAALVAVIAWEAWLGAAMALRAIGAMRGFALSLLGLALASAALVHARMRLKVGEDVQCGCYGDAIGGSLTDELVRNAWMAGVLVLLVAWGLVVGRRK